MLVAGAFAVAADLEVAPGTVVRWPGEELLACSRGDRTWKPSAGACWYAVDLLAPEGPLELGRRTASGPETRVVRVSSYIYPVQRITLEDDSRVDLSPENLERVRGEQRRVAALWETAPAPRFSLPLAAPLADLPPGGRFGSRRFFNDQPRSPHSGADYAAAAGTEVLAAATGRVVLADDLFFSGESLFLDHGDGLVSMYFHLSERRVGEGERVERGQVIGRGGATGRATGPHLHFGLRWRGSRIDPALLLGPPEQIPTLR